MLKTIHINTLTVGMHVWCAHYSFTSNGTRCTFNVEPTEFIIKELSSNFYSIKAQQVNSKKKPTYLPTDYVFDSKKNAEEHYRERIGRHVKHLLDRISYFSTIGTMSKRLNKYGLSELDRDLKEISSKAEDIIRKIDANA